MAPRLSSIVCIIGVLFSAARHGHAQMGFPYLGGLAGSPLAGFMQQPPPEPLMTCISVNPMDPNAQMRLTIRPETFLGGIPQQHPLQQLTALSVDQSAPTEWIVEGVITPGTRPYQGSFYAAVTQFGRTIAGRCFSNSLGPIVQGTPRLPFPSLMSPFGGLIPGMQALQQQPAGVLSNPVLLSNGVSTYTGRLSGLSFNQINGGGLALCSQVSQDQCIGHIPMCCSITRDQLPATQTILQPQNGNNIDVMGRGRAGSPFGNPLGVGGGMNVGRGLNMGAGLGGLVGAFDGPELFVGNGENLIDNGLDANTNGLFGDGRADRVNELF